MANTSFNLVTPTCFDRCSLTHSSIVLATFQTEIAAASGSTMEDLGTKIPHFDGAYP